jgi:hypothetical protein
VRHTHEIAIRNTFCLCEVNEEETLLYIHITWRLDVEPEKRPTTVDGYVFSLILEQLEIVR